WSPDGKQMAITLSRKDGDVDVYTLELATQMLTRITDDPGIDTEPSWSRDGSKIYFTSDRSGSAQIYETNVNDMKHVPRRITFEGNYNARARISPDGKQLAMVHQDNGNFRIAVQDLKSGSLQVLSTGQQDESPSYAPNGAQIMFSSQSRGHGVLMLVSTDGRSQQTLSVTSGDVREAAWGPLPPKP
ncbi:MAG: Tol-Pal system protein TolB, partial [Steroidobacter sp.]